MNKQTNKDDDSALLQEVLNEFLERLSIDETVPTHIVSSLKEHFTHKTSISVPEVRSILMTDAEVP